MTPSSISALIMTKNEEQNLAACLQSVRWCDDIVVVDSGSTDGTVAAAKAYGCRVVERLFDNWASHQNWILRNVDFKHRWVFNLDADERVGAGLQGELCAAVKEPGPYVAYRVRRKDYYQNRWLKHATFYPTWLTRLFIPGHVTFERLVNPVACISGGIGLLKGHIEHWPFSKGVGHWIERHNSYSTFEAIEYERHPRLGLSNFVASDYAVRRRALKTLFARTPCRPLIKFCYLYVYHKGFMDGRAGLDYCILQAIYEYFISMKVRERALK